MSPSHRTAVIGGAVIALAVAAVLLVYPTDHNPDWIDILEEVVFLAGGVAAFLAAARLDSPVLLAGTVLLTLSLALEVADEFVVEAALVGSWLTTLAAAAGMTLVARSLLDLAASQRRGREHLQSSEERFTQLFDLCPVPMAVFDHEGTFVTINSACERASGYKRGELIGQRPSAINLFDQPDTGQQILRRLATERQGPVRATVRVRTRMGASHTVEIVAERIQLAEGPAIIAAGHDVTDQSTLLREIERYQGQLEVAALKDDFIATMSHELRTPLTAVIGAADTLAQGGTLGSRQHELVTIVSASAQHLLAVINDILELSKLEAGRATIQREPVDIAATCDAAWLLVAGRAEAKWLESHFSIPKGSGSIFTDGRRLKQMLLNLLDNAVKFTSPGGRIGLDVTRDPAKGTVAFTVWDSGPGIPMADRVRLFQPFVQLHAPAAGQQNGTGLGLALVRRTARALGGDAHVGGTAGEGSRFTITLPLNPPAA